MPEQKKPRGALHLRILKMSLTLFLATKLHNILQKWLNVYKITANSDSLPVVFVLTSSMFLKYLSQLSS